METDILTRNIGLTNKEARVYETILQLGEGTIQPIARRSNIRRTSIYYFIDHLVELGLIDAVKVRGRMHYKALPPQKLLSLQLERTDEIREALPEFLGIYNASAKKPKISYYEGAGQIQNILMEETRCEKEVLGIWPGQVAVPTVGGVKFMEKIDRMRRARGVHLKVIRFRDKETIFRGSGHGEEHLREIRFAKVGTQFPVAIGIYDTGKVGFITSRREGFGIMIESSEVHAAMKFLFGLFWAEATTARENEG